MNKNTIAFQKGLIVINVIGIDNRCMAMTVQAELMKFGYMLTPEALDALGHSDAADIKDFHSEVIDFLLDMTGGKRNYQPIYPGFPKQVMDMTEMDLWINQFIGYYGNGSFTPCPWLDTKKAAFEHVKYKPIELGTEEEFARVFTTLAGSGQALTPNDTHIIGWFVNTQDFLVFPTSMPFKELLCTIMGIMIKIGRGLETVQLPKLTTTDVLRIAVYMSWGDISLPAVPPKHIGRYGRNNANPSREAFKFRKFKRAERKFILALLESSNLDVREMKLKAQRWIRLGEILHPGEYGTIFPRSFQAFQRLRNEKVVSWYGEVQKAFQMSFDVGLAKLSERPGEFLRRLDWMLRTSDLARCQSIFNVMSKIGIISSNKVLFEVYDHFEKRRDPSIDRKIMIKGARKHTSLPDLPAISKEKVDAVQATIFEILKTKFSALPELGDCWIDEDLKKIPLPINMRSLADTLVPLVRGQRISFGTGKRIIRPFIHWFDPDGSIDIDLHGFLFGPKQTVNFGYNGIHSSTIGCYSGDVRHRRGACAEYVDIDVEAALVYGYDHFIMVAHNFNGGKLSDIKECVAGVMEREFPEANSTWKPDTIVNAMKLTGDSRMTLVAAYDLKTREYIHLDLDFDTFATSLRTSSGSFLDGIKPYMKSPKVSVYDLLLWHVEARGRVVSKETATTHFLYDDFSTSYTKTIEFMGI
ncbi:MAG: hypothetical protein ACOH2V_00445 [Candidatus Saccharimonadaceae bacterium]